tara:strand:- start:950 stop:1165 length:216 start_codon:yes stop_codon:yes gene_type:complete
MADKKVKKEDAKKDNLKEELDSLVGKYNELQKIDENLVEELSKVRIHMQKTLGAIEVLSKFIKVEVEPSGG